jgi:hypothetical protein
MVSRPMIEISFINIDDPGRSLDRVKGGHVKRVVAPFEFCPADKQDRLFSVIISNYVSSKILVT